MKNQNESNSNELTSKGKAIIDSLVQKLTAGGGDGRISVADYQNIHQTMKDQGLPFHQAYRHLIENYKSNFTAKALKLAQTYKGISHLAKGFNYLQMHSYNLTLNGQEKLAHIFDIDPNKPYFQHTEHNTATQHSSTTKSVVDYLTTHEEHVHAEASIGISFVAQGSASVDFTKSYNNHSSASSFHSYVRSINNNDEYGIDLDSNNIPLSPAFETAISELPVLTGALKNASPKDQAAYTAIIDKFGTHFSYKIMLGGKYFMNKDISSKDYYEMENNSINVELGAEGTFRGVTFGVKVAKDEKNTKAYKSDVSVSHEDITYVGGDIVPDSKKKQGEWSKSLRDYPGLIDVDLDEILSIITKKYFPKDSSIEHKQTNLREALNHYYSSKGLVLDKDFKTLAPVTCWSIISDTSGKKIYTAGDGGTSKNQAEKIAQINNGPNTVEVNTAIHNLGYFYPSNMPKPEGSTPVMLGQTHLQINQGENQTLIGYTKGIIPVYSILYPNTATMPLYTVDPTPYLNGIKGAYNFIGHVVTHVYADNPLINNKDFYYPKKTIKYGDVVSIRQKNPTYKGIAPFMSGVGSDSTTVAEWHGWSGEKWTVTNRDNPSDRSAVKYGDTVYLQSDYKDKYLGVSTTNPSNKQKLINTASVPGSKNGFTLTAAGKSTGTEVNFLYDTVEFLNVEHYVVGFDGDGYLVDKEDLSHYNNAQEWVILPAENYPNE
jgi:hypothetical protein